jgi:hypothetical protein
MTHIKFEISKEEEEWIVRTCFHTMLLGFLSSLMPPDSYAAPPPSVQSVVQ